jgi:hypothetical protein
MEKLIKMRDALRARRDELEVALERASVVRLDAFRAIDKPSHPLNDDEFDTLVEAYDEARGETDTIEAKLEEINDDLTTLSDAISIYYKWRREGI